jgi:hypothetical protein
MANVLDSQTIAAEATLVSRTQELARTLTTKLAQGYKVESQTDTEAILVIRGRKRWFRPSKDTRQHVKVDEFGTATFAKIEAALN